mgnify:FL=1
MRKKVTIHDINGQTFEADVVSLFKYIPSNKKYMFFTKNEILENSLVKMYISEIILESGNIKLENTMNDEEWNSIKEIMRNILTGKQNTNIEYMEVGE